MQRAATEPPLCHHVVFASEVRTSKRVNFAPVTAACATEPCSGELTLSDMSFLRAVFEQAGLNWRFYRHETLKRRISACLRLLRVPTAREGARAIRQNPALLSVAVDALVLGVTRFFRDHAVFADLRDNRLPLLLGGRPGLKVWSAGCSSGAELYSVAALLAERGALVDSYLLGTDCRPGAIAQAKAGIYPASMLASVPQAYIESCFTVENDTARVNAALTAVTRWRVADLTTECEPGAWDLVLCRNFTMYLLPEAAATVWRGIETTLRPGGLLITGKVERPTGCRYLTQIAPCLYRCERAGLSLEPSRRAL